MTQTQRGAPGPVDTSERDGPMVTCIVGAALAALVIAERIEGALARAAADRTNGGIER